MGESVNGIGVTGVREWGKAQRQKAQRHIVTQFFNSKLVTQPVLRSSVLRRVDTQHCSRLWREKVFFRAVVVAELELGKFRGKYFLHFPDADAGLSSRFHGLQIKVRVNV